MTIERRHVRYVVRLPCRIDLKDNSLSAEVVDLSAEGARLMLPFAGNTQDLWGVTSLLIDPIGRFEVKVRWQSGNYLGVAIASPGDRIEQFIIKMQYKSAPLN